VSGEDQIPAEGDKWTTCGATTPPFPQTGITMNCATTGNSGDIGFKKATGGGTLTHPVKITPVTGCLIAP
jgi:hypothetical protein